MPIEWKDVSKWLTDAGNTAIREGRELARKGRVEYDILALRHKITQTMTELGSTVYQLLDKQKEADVAGNENVKDLLAGLHDLELKLKRKERERKTKKTV
jgi:hypothetical protein